MASDDRDAAQARVEKQRKPKGKHDDEKRQRAPLDRTWLSKEHSRLRTSLEKPREKCRNKKQSGLQDSHDLIAVGGD